MKNYIKKSYFVWLIELKNYLLMRYAHVSYSQEGEDLILERIFEGQNRGFYVDIGAHHPIRFSNSYLFYKKGWYGINIDPMPGCMKKFNIFRPKDINIEHAVSDNNKKLKYYIFNDPALNTFDKDLKNSLLATTNYIVQKTIKVSPVPLREILRANLRPETVIDFISIDVEGHQYQVIISNDWSIYRPKVLLIEILSNSVKNLASNSTVKYIEDQGYVLFSKTFSTCFFIDYNFFKKRFKNPVIKNDNE